MMQLKQKEQKLLFFSKTNFSRTARQKAENKNKLRTNRSSRPEVFLRKDVLKMCSKFTGEHPCRSAISIKLLCNFIEIALRRGCSPVGLLHIFRTTFSRNISGWLLQNKLCNAVKQKIESCLFFKVKEFVLYRVHLFLKIMLHDQDTKPLTLQQTCQWACGFYNYVTQQHKGFKKHSLLLHLFHQLEC